MKSRKRSRKNLDARIKQLMGLALRVNRETKHSVFLDFSGHVKQVSVQIHLGGWSSSSDPDYSKYFYLDYVSPHRFAACAEIRAKLNSLLPRK